MLLKFKVICICLLVGFCLAGSQACAQTNFNVFFGQKSLSKSDWEPVDKQLEIGIEVDFKQEDWPISLALSYSQSADDGKITEYDDTFGFIDVDCKSKTSELNIGAKKTWDQPSDMHPFIAGGLSYIDATGEAKALGVTVSDSDSNIGFWIGTGIYWTINNVFNFGVELKYSDASVTLLDENIKVGGFHYGLIAGYYF